MKIAVIGSRTFDDKEFMFATLDKINGKELIVSGGATGADRLAELYAKAKDIPLKVFKADWNTHGKRAGLVRNELIVKEADMIVAFWNGKSRGTRHSLDLAAKAGKPTMIIRFTERAMEISM